MINALYLFVSHGILESAQRIVLLVSPETSGTEHRQVETPYTYQVCVLKTCGIFYREIELSINNFLKTRVRVGNSSSWTREVKLHGAVIYEGHSGKIYSLNHPRAFRCGLYRAGVNTWTSNYEMNQSSNVFILAFPKTHLVMG